MTKLTVSGLALGAMLLSGAAPSFASEYGAIAFSPTSGAHGYSHNFSTRRAAENEAMGNCRAYGRGCRIVVWFRDACGALAVGSGNGHGFSWAQTRRQAENRAMSNCRNYANSCQVVRWVCSR